jgi:hypothetical protein
MNILSTARTIIKIIDSFLTFWQSFLFFLLYSDFSVVFTLQKSGIIGWKITVVVGHAIGVYEPDVILAFIYACNFGYLGLYHFGSSFKNSRFYIVHFLYFFLIFKIRLQMLIAFQMSRTKNGWSCKYF